MCIRPTTSQQLRINNSCSSIPDPRSLVFRYAANAAVGDNGVSRPRARWCFAVSVVNHSVLVLIQIVIEHGSPYWMDVSEYPELNRRCAKGYVDRYLSQRNRTLRSARVRFHDDVRHCVSQVYTCSFMEYNETIQIGDS
jgi:hypothetical protein